MKLSILPILLLLNLCVALSAFASDTKTHTNHKYKFTLEYPSTYELQTSDEVYFDLLRNDEISLRASIEDNAFKIFIRESKQREHVFGKFARERCKIVCGADGPDGSSFCEKVESEKGYITSNGLRVLEFSLVMVQEDYLNYTRLESLVGPVYMVDISRENRPLALMIFPEHGKLASASTKRLAEEIIDTIRLLE